jgi:CRISPR-associated protein Csm5
MRGRLLKARLHILSPIHIGCDDVYEPTHFVIDKNKNILITFDPLNFIKSLSPSEKQKITEISTRGDIESILKIYEFISKKLASIKGINVEISSALSKHYEKVLNLLKSNDKKNISNEINNFVINRTAFNPNNNLPYIPGSSLKGSFRTGYLNWISKNGTNNNFSTWKADAAKILDTDEEKAKIFAKKNKKLEEDILGGSFYSDPFSMIKISDFLPVKNIKTKILYAVIKNKKIPNPIKAPRGPSQILEIINEGSIFEGVININNHEDSPEIKKPIDLDNILKALNTFYRDDFIKENDKVLKKFGASSGSYDIYNNKYKGEFHRGCFVRIGRHSGAEAVTVEGVRKIKINQKNGEPPKYLEHTTRIWLASEESNPKTNEKLLPFGWAILEILE